MSCFFSVLEPGSFFSSEGAAGAGGDDPVGIVDGGGWMVNIGKFESMQVEIQSSQMSGIIYLGRKVGGWLKIRRWLKTWWRRLRCRALSTSAKGALSVEARPVKGKVG